MATLSQNVTQAISDFASIKTAIENKGVTVPAGTPTSDYAELIDDIPEGDESVFIGVIERSPISVIIPDGTVSIGDYAFYHYTNLQNITIPDSVTYIGKYAFTQSSISSLTIGSGVTTIDENAFQNALTASSLVIPVNVQTIGKNAFSQHTSLNSVVISNGVKTLGVSAFSGCTFLITLSLPNSLTSIGVNAFYLDSYLTNVTLESGFNASGLNLSASTRYSAATIVGWLNALYDRTGLAAYTLTIGATNLNKLTAEQIAIATNKNWNLA